MVLISIEIIILIYGYMVIRGLMTPDGIFVLRKNKTIVFVFLFWALVVFSFYITPSESSDLSFYFRQVIRGQSEGIKDVFDFQKNPLIVWHFITFAVGKMNNVHFLTSIVVGFTLFFWILNIKIVTNSIEISNKAFALYFVLFVGLFTWTNLFSVLRNTIVFSITACIIVYDLISGDRHKGKKLPVEIILWIVCCLIHPATIMVLGFYIAGKYLLKKWYGAVILVVWPQALEISARILSTIDSVYVRYLVEKIQLYSSDSQYSLSIAFPKYVFILLFTMGLWCNRKRWEQLDMKRVLEKFVVHFNDLYQDQNETFLEEEGRKYFLLYLRPIINGTGNYYIETRTRDLRRTDVIVDYRGEQFIVEMKIWRGEEYHQRGKEQLSEYLDAYHQKKGYMISFNFNKKKRPGVYEAVVGDKILVEAVV